MLKSIVIFWAHFIRSNTVELFKNSGVLIASATVSQKFVVTGATTWPQHYHFTTIRLKFWWNLYINLRSSFWDIIFILSKNIEILLFFRFFWPWVTLDDLELLKTIFFWKTYFKSFILRYHLPTLKKYWNLTLFRDFWPWVTSNDLLTNFSEKLKPRASFWYIICIVCVNS